MPSLARIISSCSASIPNKDDNDHDDGGGGVRANRSLLNPQKTKIKTSNDENKKKNKLKMKGSDVTSLRRRRPRRGGGGGLMLVQASFVASTLLLILFYNTFLLMPVDQNDSHAFLVQEEFNDSASFYNKSNMVELATTKDENVEKGSQLSRLKRIHVIHNSTYPTFHHSIVGSIHHNITVGSIRHNITRPNNSSNLYNKKMDGPKYHGHQQKDKKKKPPCALLFFGLVKHFDLALPAIKQNIIHTNPNCDIYVHTFNVTHLPINPRNNENVPIKLFPYDAFLLTDNVVFDSMEYFGKKRKNFLDHSRKFHHKRVWGPCCLSHDNMIKQWHSIEGVWDLMRQHEEDKLLMMKQQEEKTWLSRHTGQNDTSKVSTKKYGYHEERNFFNGSASYYYHQIGFFRLDVYNVNKIDIFDSNATSPNWGRFGGKNDRLFYGSRKNAQVWAKRFDFAKIFERRYMRDESQSHDGYHSEYYLDCMLRHYDIEVEEKPICVWRIRSEKVLSIQDCSQLYRFSNVTVLLQNFAPPGYMATGT